MSNSNALLTASEAAEILGVTRSALCARRKRGDAPPWLNLTPGLKQPNVRYRLPDILALKTERETNKYVRLTTPLPDRIAALEARVAELEGAA